MRTGETLGYDVDIILVRVDPDHLCFFKKNEYLDGEEMRRDAIMVGVINYADVLGLKLMWMNGRVCVRDGKQGLGPSAEPS